jgi:hypothetical protein
MYLGPHLLLANRQGGPPPRRGAAREMQLPESAAGLVLRTDKLVICIKLTFMSTLSQNHFQRFKIIKIVRTIARNISC